MTAPDTSPDPLAVHELAMRRFDAIASATQDQRTLSLAARRFVSIPGAQWEGQWEAQFANSIRVEVNKTARGLEKIVNDYRANRLTVDFRAVGGSSSKDTAQTLQGMHRADAYHFKAQQARDNAFEEAAAGGFGAWRLLADYADPYDEDNDEQRINPGMAIVDADQSVFFDMNAKLYDKSDARFAFVVTPMTRDAFEEEYPDANSTWPDVLIKPHYDWYAPDICRVGEYYLVDERTETLRTFDMKLSGATERFFDSELDAAARREMLLQGWKQSAIRKVKRRRVRKYTMCGASIIEDHGFIAGDCIPVVPVYGKRWFIDNQERWRGHVQLAMDPQRVFNAMISKLSETAALAPREIPIFTPEQVAGHEARWAAQNIERHPYALVNPIIGVDGNPMPAGAIGMLNPPQLSPVLAALIQQTGSDIAELTQSQDNTNQTRSNVSAEALDIAATRFDAQSMTYMDNMRQSVQREGEVYLSMAREVYYEPGRDVETQGDDGTEGTATLHDGVTDDQGVFTIRNDIARGKYNVVSDVTEATSTRRDKTVRACLNIASVATAAQDLETASAAMTTAILQMDGDGLDDFQAFMRKKALGIGLVKPTKDEQAQMDKAAETASQNAPADPAAQVAQAQGTALLANAKKDNALADKAVADTALSHAKATQTLMAAHHANTAAPIHRVAAHNDMIAKHIDSLSKMGIGVGQLGVAQHAAKTARLKVVNDITNSQSEGTAGSLTPANSETLS